MKIAFLHQPNDPYTEVRLKYFVSKGHEVYSLVFPRKVKQKEIEGLHIIEMPSIGVNLFIKRFAYFSFVRSFTKKNKIEILYTVSALNSFYLKASKAKKNILELQGSDVIVWPRKLPVIKMFYRFFWRNADAITQDSEIAKRSAEPLFPKGIINETINIGVDFSIFNDKVEKGKIRKKYNLKDAPIVLHTRSLKKIYNPEILIRSIIEVKEKFPDVYYLITGTKEMLSVELQKIVTNFDLEKNIIFTGRLDHEKEIKYYYADADVCVSIPSSDSSPFSVYEAMATMTPVIVSDLPWVTENFEKNRHLVVLKKNSSTLLANAIIELVQKSLHLDIESAFQIVNKNINKDLENRKLENLFSSIIH